MRVAWIAPIPGEHRIELRTRNSTPRRRRAALPEADRSRPHLCARPHHGAEHRLLDGELRAVLLRAGLFSDAQLSGQIGTDRDAARKHAEEVFHDEWAASVDVTKINVRQMNEACTAPEMRCIRQTLGNLRGQTLLDVGCGLGEASV